MARFRKVRYLLLQDTEVSCAQSPTDERENLGHAQHLPESAADGQPRSGISVVRKVKLADVSWALRSPDFNLGVLCHHWEILTGKLVPLYSVWNMEFFYLLELSMDLTQNEECTYGSVSAFICLLICLVDWTWKRSHTVFVCLWPMCLS